MKNKYEYLCFWGEGFYGVKDEAKTKKVNESFFTKENGYDSEDIEKISYLEIGQPWQCPDFYNHCVVRIK